MVEQRTKMSKGNKFHESTVSDIAGLIIIRAKERMIDDKRPGGAREGF